MSANLRVLLRAPPARYPTHGEGMSPRAAACPASHTDACHIGTEGPHVPSALGGEGCVPPAEATGSSGVLWQLCGSLWHPLVQLGFPKAELESPGPASPQHGLLPVLSPALQAGWAPGPAPSQSWRHRCRT